MVEEKEEEKPQSVKEERALSVLEQIKEERAAVEITLAESIKVRDELRELRAIELLSGKTDAGKQEKPKEETALEYSTRIMRD